MKLYIYYIWIHKDTNTDIYICTHIRIYIYGKREKERDAKKYVNIRTRKKRRRE